MNDKKCPAPEHLLAWLDGETTDESTALHISSCPVCREVIGVLQEETGLLCAMFDAVPAPDLTGRVMAGIEAAGQWHCSSGINAGSYTAARGSERALFSVISYLVTAGVGFLLVLAYNFLPGFINLEFRPVTVVGFLTALDRLAMFLDEARSFTAAVILPGAPLIPPLILVLAVALINLIGKRRISNV